MPVKRGPGLSGSITQSEIRIAAVLTSWLVIKSIFVKVLSSLAPLDDTKRAEPIG